MTIVTTPSANVIEDQQPAWDGSERGTELEAQRRTRASGAVPS